VLQPFHPAQVTGSFFGAKEERNLESKVIDLMSEVSNDEFRIVNVLRSKTSRLSRFFGEWHVG